MATVVLCLLLAACTPADVEYCRKYSVSNISSQHGTCMNYFHQNQAAFDADYQQCLAQAKVYYPDSLYDSGNREDQDTHQKKLHNRHDYVNDFKDGVADDFIGSVVDSLFDNPQNAELNDLRNKIIAPCMYQRGWNDYKTWQAGRH